MLLLQRRGQFTAENSARYANKHGYDIVYRTVGDTFAFSNCIVRILHNGQVNVRISESCDQFWSEHPSFNTDSSHVATFRENQLSFFVCNSQPEAWTR